MKNLYVIIFFILLSFQSIAQSQIVKNILINGNDRIPEETIKLFSNISIGDELNEQKINNSLKSLYRLNFFKDISISFIDSSLVINVIENPLIENIIYSGINSKSLLDKIKFNTELKPRSSFSEYLLEQHVEQIKVNLRENGYFLSSVETYVKNLEDNKVDVTINVDLKDKSKIKKITFLGDKIFKSRELKNVIVSEESRFWKFLTNKIFLNESIIELDTRLLKNFYLNKGYYNVQINSSFARFINDDASFELTFNINTGEKYYFGDIELELPLDYDTNYFNSLSDIFSDLKGKSYSLNLVEDILDSIDNISLQEQFETVNASVIENIESNIINLKFVIEESEKFIVEKINIFGNSITRENVIRNQLLIDEGDYYNDILKNKSTNNIKSLNIFKNVSTEVIEGKNLNSKILNISVEEKPTGEIFAAAGFGTTGSTIGFGIKENNYLGKGLKLDTNLTLSTDSIKGSFTVSNPNFNNTDKSVYFSLQSLENDNLKTFGYKTNKSGFDIGTEFEYLDDLFLGFTTSNFYEKIETDSTASSLQKKQKGDYFDSFLKINLDYDKRNQKYKPSDGFLSSYNLSLPLISNNYTIDNYYSFKYFNELYEDNISTFSFLARSANSITGENIKLSERLFLPSNRLRGFVSGKVGPKDGDDYIGGNFLTALNFSSTLPGLFESTENIDMLLFADLANLWGIDYDSSINDNSKIRSTIGLGLDWLTPIGPLSFSFSQPITKNPSDVTETFRFNLGTTF